MLRKLALSVFGVCAVLGSIVPAAFAGAGGPDGMPSAISGYVGQGSTTSSFSSTSTGSVMSAVKMTVGGSTLEAATAAEGAGSMISQSVMLSPNFGSIETSATSGFNSVSSGSNSIEVNDASFYMPIVPMFEVPVSPVLTPGG